MVKVLSRNFLEGLKKQRITGNPVWIRNGYLSNTNPERYSSISLFIFPRAGHFMETFKNVFRPRKGWQAENMWNGLNWSSICSDIGLS